MSFINLGNSNQLQIKIPIKGTTGWSDELRAEFFQKLVEHDHSGNGKGAPIGPNSLGPDTVTGANIRLANDQFLRSRNAADDGDINILKVNGSNLIELGTSVVSLTTTGDVTVGNDLDVTTNATIGGALDITGDSSSRTHTYTPLGDRPLSPVEGQTYIDDGTNRTSGLYRYTGSVWVLVDAELRDRNIRRVTANTSSDVNENMQATDDIVSFYNTFSGPAFNFTLLDPADYPGKIIYLYCNINNSINVKYPSHSLDYTVDNNYRFNNSVKFCAFQSSPRPGSSTDFRWVPITSPTPTTITRQLFSNVTTTTIDIPALKITGLEANKKYRIDVVAQSSGAGSGCTLEVGLEYKIAPNPSFIDTIASLGSAADTIPRSTSVVVDTGNLPGSAVFQGVLKADVSLLGGTQLDSQRTFIAVTKLDED